MRVVNPTPGEIADRVSVLRLKVSASSGAQKDRFVREASETICHLATAFPEIAMSSKFWDLVETLFEVNVRIWNLTDEQNDLLRSGGWQQNPAQFATKSAKVVELNNERAAIVKKANLSMGIDDKGEKVR